MTCTALIQEKPKGRKQIFRASGVARQARIEKAIPERTIVRIIFETRSRLLRKLDFYFGLGFSDEKN